MVLSKLNVVQFKRIELHILRNKKNELICFKLITMCFNELYKKIKYIFKLLKLLPQPFGI